jgi:hypothetical protein
MFRKKRLDIGFDVVFVHQVFFIERRYSALPVYVSGRFPIPYRFDIGSSPNSMV